MTNVIWSTGFRSDLSWIDIPVLNGSRQPTHQRGIVDAEPGLYFIGLDFLYAASSAQINGVGRDAEHVVRAITARVEGRRSRAQHAQPTDTASDEGHVLGRTG